MELDFICLMAIGTAYEPWLEFPLNKFMLVKLCDLSNKIIRINLKEKLQYDVNYIRLPKSLYLESAGVMAGIHHEFITWREAVRSSFGSQPVVSSIPLGRSFRPSYKNAYGILHH